MTTQEILMFADEKGEPLRNVSADKLSAALLELEGIALKIKRERDVYRNRIVNAVQYLHEMIHDLAFADVRIHLEVIAAHLDEGEPFPGDLP